MRPRLRLLSAWRVFSFRRSRETKDRDNVNLSRLKEEYLHIKRERDKRSTHGMDVLN